MKNLSQCMEVTTRTTVSTELGGTPITGFSAGTGSLGLPGDFTSPARFVRATMFSAHHDTPANAADAIGEVFHLLNQFDIPRGFVTVTANGSDTTEWTLGTIARDPSGQEFHYRSYGDQSLRKVSLRTLDAQGRTQLSRVPLGPATGHHTVISDMTDQLVDAGATRRLTDAGASPASIGQGMDAIKASTAHHVDPSTQIGRRALSDTTTSCGNSFTTVMFVTAGVLALLTVAANLLMRCESRHGDVPEHI